MNIDHLFPRTVCINLDRRPDRWRRMCDRFGRYGIGPVERFAADLRSAGGSGAVTPDLIPDEAAPWIAASDAEGLDRIFLVAPSSTEARIVSTCAASRGFVYASAVMGVTGARDAVGDMASVLVERVRRLRAGRTTIAITLAPAALAACDHVVVIDGGRVLTTGTHPDLLASDTRYRVAVAPDLERDP